VDLWVDKSDVLLRYAEAELPDGKRVVIPLGVLHWSGDPSRAGGPDGPPCSS
jgi:hypothetical protein